MKMSFLKFLTFSTLTAITVVACNKIDSESKDSSKANQTISNLVEITTFENDPLVVEVINKYREVKIGYVDSAALASAIQDNNVSEDEFNTIANSLGFENADAYLEYLNELDSLTLVVGENIILTT